MIERLLEQEEAIRVVPSADRKASHLIPTWQDIDVLEAINDALSPLAAFTDVMSGEKYVTGSAVIPVTDLLTTSILKEKEDDKTLTNEIRKAIISDLSKRNTSPDVVEVLELASFLDPRFKGKYVTDEESIKEVICSDGMLIYQSATTSNTPQSSAAAVCPPAKKKRTLGSLLKMGETEETGSSAQVLPGEAINVELSLYLQEVRLDAESDPLEWWKLHEMTFPMLSKVAKKFLAVPATSAASEQLFSRSGKIVTHTRASLKPDKVEMLVFLSTNI